LDQLRVNPEVRLCEARQRRWEIDQPKRSGPAENTERAGHDESLRASGYDGGAALKSLGKRST
jgi:hypothetical protein